jgi:hypothetical protein
MCFEDFRQLVLHAVLLVLGPHMSIGTRTSTYACQQSRCVLAQEAFPWRLIYRLSFFLRILSKRETRLHNTRLPLLGCEMRVL